MALDKSLRWLQLVLLKLSVLWIAVIVAQSSAQMSADQA